MNIALIEAARERVPSVPVLVNMVSKRVRQLHNGDRPYVKPAVGEEKTDVALREIIEGKIDFAKLDEESATAGIL